MLRFIFAFLLALAITQTSAQNPLCYAYTYNAQNKIIREHITGPGTTVDILHTYDDRGRETETKQVDSASGQTALLMLTTYYDPAQAYDKKIVTIFYYSAEKPDTTVRYQTLNAQGRVTIDSLTHHGPLSKTVFTYNDTMLIREVCYSSGGEQLERAEYAYNDQRQLISKTYTHWKGYSVIEYAYDKKGRLTAEKRIRILEFSDPEKLGTIAEYTYNKTGQLISKSESGKAIDTIQIPTTTTYSYDQNGRLVSRCTVYSPD